MMVCSSRRTSQEVRELKLSQFCKKMGAERRTSQEVRELKYIGCLLYTSDAADDLLCVDLGGSRLIQKKKKRMTSSA